MSYPVHLKCYRLVVWTQGVPKVTSEGRYTNELTKHLT